MVFWPAKLRASDRVVMFRFEFWDCGESALKKFDHMLPVSPQVGLGGGGRGGLTWASEVLPGLQGAELGVAWGAVPGGRRLSWPWGLSPSAALGLRKEGLR